MAATAKCKKTRATSKPKLCSKELKTSKRRRTSSPVATSAKPPIRGASAAFLANLRPPSSATHNPSMACRIGDNILRPLMAAEGCWAACPAGSITPVSMWTIMMGAPIAMARSPRCAAAPIARPSAALQTATSAIMPITLLTSALSPHCPWTSVAKSAAKAASEGSSVSDFAAK
eukprot:CAMPEP_0115400922 /NCGR_PEP_ID=MMETSP0271-20121206/15610_1 /TAXON_ID=71861 /ORGANISM="Scrippsiella trochoidea, Strain CCMP3099" /LENGTH=173 /DNA_ID=CAMNT_0002824797 /DNA_START=122 /DNA_END=643 /DNA_ORIENTATION=+